ncbi:hypothetical protein [Actinotalea sp. Marseille-Q4924]|uniref:hypothetical protein n=1 Tax=Actinotalea sp. Marseille-Q4924 TaxID=2866571 RepID=UPI001CE41847|nr:hypothetical protein [Actinotalea sp. Marseille-Q4924]
MTETILLLTEDALTTADVQHITTLHAGDDVAYRVLVPADTEQNMLVSIVDHLSLGELREALDAALGREEKPDAARRTAAEQLATTLAELRACGAAAEGVVVEDDPLPALRAAVAAGPVREVVVVTRPHAVEDTFHTDWASRARDVLEVPVMHLYSGTNLLG